MAKGRKNMAPGNMNGMMKQVQKMQQNLQKAQEEIEQKEFEATAGGGAIKAVVNGKKEIISITLEESIVDSDDIEMLQDLIIVVINDALKKADETMGKEMGKLTGGMNIPGLF
ncbi:YbaB/EbfC family nucleoid-associated protein [Helicovermis profundi]|uniref:Nucleoid-associated protein HLPR_27650 n=1 Tax=Helicovermis profundi TaxID=3065157 RepID=A0AAU9EQH8_9FIRM|nr:YbaB/EbfC family nucleoid-associated protein [Clostridia bacterium S502]